MTSITSASAATDSPRRLWLRILVGIVLTVALAAVVFLAGPVNEFGPAEPSARALPPDNIAALEEWVKTSEAAYPDIRPGTEKRITWNSPDKQRTPWAVVYIHGYSASRLESEPVTEMVAKALGANTFSTRLSGHGRTGAAMAQVSAQDWMADTVEAVRIGQTLGERVLLVSCSTGSTLATWLATSSENHKVAAHVLVSPNFGPRDKRAEIINGPWGKQIVIALQGETRTWTPKSEAEAHAWTSSYPMRSIFPMMSLVKHVRDSDLSTFLKPVLILYSANDQVVDPEEIQAAFERFGAPLKAIEAVTYSSDLYQHVLAGKIKSPEGTEPMVQSIVKWAQSLPAEKPAGT